MEKTLETTNSTNEDFNPGAPPPFRISEIRAAIPKHCWVKNPWKSLSYVIRDVFVVFTLAGAAFFFNNWIIWPFYWVIQGTMFWALFVLGHDCGHGSFSEYPKLNSLVGHIPHSFILVPYNGWRISHRTHHQNHGHVENDESWVPLTEEMYKSLSLIEATKAAKPVLGKYYWEPKKSGPFPFHLFGNLVKSIGEDHYVSDTGDVVFYQSDNKLYRK